MKAMILAAGNGERMRPLTEHTPKPLLRAGGRALIEYHLLALSQSGITEVVINHGRLGKQIESYLGNGMQYGLHLFYSPEGDYPLETGGGIFRALPMLGSDPFLIVNADIWTDYPYKQLINQQLFTNIAHLVLVNNPEHHPQGDFNLINGQLSIKETERLTFSGIGVYHPKLFKNSNDSAFPLAPLLRAAITNNQVSGEHWNGKWMDIGTPTRLAILNNMLSP